MSKTTKSKNGKVPKLTEEEYAQYISSLKGLEDSLNATTETEKNTSAETEKREE